eukprot:NODE_1247_length_1626_cov_0.478062.p2 type:complete len:104 gc:universal NODE_1247_length_1626_cov_0.478062:140-451(+)
MSSIISNQSSILCCLGSNDVKSILGLFTLGKATKGASEVTSFCGVCRNPIICFSISAIRFLILNKSSWQSWIEIGSLVTIFQGLDSSLDFFVSFSIFSFFLSF